MSESTEDGILHGEPIGEIDRYASVVDVFHGAVAQYRDRPAFSCMGQTLTFDEVEQLSGDFAAWLIHETALVPGDRIAIQLPNVLQFPVAVFGALRAGLVLVNTNPLYTEREMLHQFRDADISAVVILANMASKLEHILEELPVKQVVVTELADLHPLPRRWLINTAVKRIKKMVPPFTLPTAIKFRDALSRGRLHGHEDVHRHPHDLAVLQYTGGTTGKPKGAMLSHHNLIANMVQARKAIGSTLRNGQELVVAPLPVYHIYTFTLNCLFLMETGNHSLLIPNPRDLDGFVKTLKNLPFTAFIGLNTLFNALCQREDFKQLDFSSLHLTISGGMALNSVVAERWQTLTGCQIAEGYGLTETSPVVSFNPVDAIQLGSIGKPVAGTSVKVMDELGHQLGFGQPGEMLVKGPQVMQGYWRQPKETRQVFDADGWVRTGDIAVLQPDGYIWIVDRKKDMILVSGFNVYPNEIEEVVASHPDVVESAAVGVPDSDSGEAVMLYVVSRNPALDQDTLRQWCRQALTPYKVPRLIAFRDQLPKTNVGKVLRRELRDSVDTSSK